MLRLAPTRSGARPRLHPVRGIRGAIPRPWGEGLAGSRDGSCLRRQRQPPMVPPNLICLCVSARSHDVGHDESAGTTHPAYPSVDHRLDDEDASPGKSVEMSVSAQTLGREPASSRQDRVTLRAVPAGRGRFPIGPLDATGIAAWFASVPGERSALSPANLSAWSRRPRIITHIDPNPTQARGAKTPPLVIVEPHRVRRMWCGRAPLRRPPWPSDAPHGLLARLRATPLRSFWKYAGANRVCDDGVASHG
jgi:hypothetical protein